MNTGFQRKGQSAAARISRQIGRAIGEFELLAEGDRLLVAVSGGKDSLTLLHMLHARRGFAPISYDLVAAHVTGGASCGSHTDAEGLATLCANLDVPFHVIDGTPELPAGEDLTCHRCSTARRNALFRLAREVGANKLALGHHLDDIVETVLLNLFFRGELSAMLPKLALFDGRLTLVRPLCLVEEKDVVRYVEEEAGFSRQAGTCDVGEDGQRKKMKELVASVERAYPNVRWSVLRALRNIKHDYLF